MESQKKPARKTRRSGWPWLLVLLVLIIWNVLTFMPRSRPEVTIPYTTLLQQVRAGNVSVVQIAGSQRLLDPYLMPN